MNFVSKISTLPNLLMNKFSSVFLASADGYVSSFLDTDSLFTRLLRWLFQVFYFATKWMMYMIDVMYFYLLQLVGVTTDTSVFDSPSIDPTFKLLIDNKEEVTRIVRNFIAIAVVIIIVVSVIALIKQQSQALKEAKTKKNPTNEVLKGMLKAVVLLVVTPILVILGIMASTMMLQGLYRATNLSNTNSLSGRIFNASATAANKYKAYADNGVRIPIKYHFSDEETKKDAIHYTATMVSNGSFPNIGYFNENENHSGGFVDPVLGGDEIETMAGYTSAVDTWVNEVYYKYFDRSEDYAPEFNSADKYRVMITHRNEYYAMSDVIGYALDTMEPLYFVTIQELLESVVKNDTATNDNLKTLADLYKVRLLDATSSVIYEGNYASMANAIRGGSGISYSFIQYTSRYEDGDHTYVHVKDSVDEMEGAKFVIAYRVENDTTTYSDSIYGDYIVEGSVPKKVEKFYYRENSNSRLLKVDLYYTYNEYAGKYEKALTYDTSKTYYYRLGEDYYKIDSTNSNKFYFKLEDGSFRSLTSLGMNFKNINKVEYYMPLASGVAVGKNFKFSSSYILPSNIITARGIFDDATYPTAMKRLENGNVMFYRDDLEVIADGSISDVGTMEDIEAEEENEDSKGKSFFGKIGSAIKSFGASVKKFITSIFNPLKMVPDLMLDESKMASTYTNKTKSVAEIEGGKMHISYFFSDCITSKLTKSQYSLNLNSLFEPLHINYVVLVVGSAVLFRIILNSIFGVINRAISLFILFLIYPVACSTIPLDDSSGALKSGSYAKWSDRFIKLVFSTFGLILSINFVFVVIPVLEEIDFFKPENLQDNSALLRIATAITMPMNILREITGGAKVVPNYNLICELVNKILRIIFQIAAFSLIVSGNGKKVQGKENFYTVIQNLVRPGGEGVLEGSPVEAVKGTLKKVSNIAIMMVNPVKTVKTLAKKGAEVAKEGADFIPGSAIAKDAAEYSKAMGNVNKMEVARKALMAALDSGADKSEVEEKLKDFQDTHKK